MSLTGANGRPSGAGTLGCRPFFMSTRTPGARTHTPAPGAGKEKPVGVEAAGDPGLLNTSEISERLRVSVRRVERLRIHRGLPAIDLGLHRSDKRPKHDWRYYWPDVIEWARQNSQNGSGK